MAISIKIISSALQSLKSIFKESLDETSILKDGGGITEKNKHSVGSRKRATKDVTRILTAGDGAVVAGDNTYLDMEGFQSFTCHLNNYGVSNNDVFQFESSNDNISWTGFRVRMLAGYMTNAIGFPDYVPMQFRLGNHIGGFIFGANTPGKYVRLRYTNVTANVIQCACYLSENYIPPADTNFANSLEAQSTAILSGPITTAATTQSASQIAAAGSAAIRQALLRIIVTNTGTGPGDWEIYEGVWTNSTTLTNKVTLWRETIGAGMRVDVNFERMPIKTSAGSRSLNFGLVSPSNMSVSISSIVTPLFAT